MKPRLLVVDDHPIFRSGVRNALADSGDYESVAEAGSVREAREALAGGGFGLVVADLGLPDGSGFDLVESFASEPGSPRFFVLSMNADRHSARKALRLGASGYASKNIGLATLILGLRLVALGEVFIEGELLRDLLTAEAPEPCDRSLLRARFEALSPRERDALDSLLEGLTTKEAASRLGVSHRTAENYQSSIYAKLGVESPLALLRLAARAGLVSLL